MDTSETKNTAADTKAEETTNNEQTSEAAVPNGAAQDSGSTEVGDTNRRKSSDSGRRSRSNSTKDSASAKPKTWKVKDSASAPAKKDTEGPAPVEPAITAASSSSPVSSPITQQKQPTKPRSRKGTKEDLESPTGSAGQVDSSILGHRLHTPWTFWFSRKDRKRSNSITAGPSGTVIIDKKLDKKEHMDNLVQIGTCRTVEEFWHHYAYIQRASNLPKESNLYFFRNQLKPMWETFPKGGCFIIKVEKRTGSVDKMWEELLFAAIGEAFEDPNVVGVEVSIRSKEDGLSIWTKTNQKQLRLEIGEKLKLLLGLDDVMYKSNATSIKDRSTYKNAQKILVAS